MKTLLWFNWKTRKINGKFEFLTLYFNNKYHGWGFDFFKINWNYKVYSLFGIYFSLPDGAYRKRITWCGDLFFLRTGLLKLFYEMDDSFMWNRQMSKSKKIIYRILKYIFI